MLSVLPIITPPFVIGLALILLFGRSGAVSGAAVRVVRHPALALDLRPCPACCIAQLLAFTPIAFLVLIGVVQGISPTLEEASQTLRAKSWTTFCDRDAAADAARASPTPSCSASSRAWPISAIRWCSAAISRCSRPRSSSPSSAPRTTRAAPPCSSIILLAFTLGAFWLQHAWLGKKVYTTVTGKGDAGLPLPLPRRVALAVLRHGHPVGGASPSPSTSIILVGGFVRAMGRDYTPTLEHFLTGFRIETTPTAGLFFSGSAWNSFFATLEGRGDLGAAHRGDRPAHRLSADAPALRRPARLRVRHAAELRHPRHGGRRQPTSSPSTCRRSRSPAPASSS